MGFSRRLQHSPRAQRHRLSLQGCSIDTDMLSVPLAPVVCLLLPKLQHLEFGSGSDPNVLHPLSPSFLSPLQPGGVNFASKLSTLTIEGEIVLSMDSLLGDIGSMHHLASLALRSISVMEDFVEDVQELHHVCDLAPLVHLQRLHKLKLIGMGTIVNLDAVLHACGRLTDLELQYFKVSEPLHVGSASVSQIRLGANSLCEYAEIVDMSLFPSLKSVMLGVTTTGKNGGPVAVGDAEHHLQRLHLAAKKVTTWPKNDFSWRSLMIVGLNGGSSEQQMQFASALLHALSPLAGSAAAACLESLEFDGQLSYNFSPTVSSVLWLTCSQTFLG
ncbi:hypothetical protein DUNSADRAFT_15430 [Dunaliella salina]|uniref:Uncharacterized protein n=1 Tax=Dunaliella salina TaxID=3046 RepID=A0ABQ7G5H4_DUNSA|nr:hypothetical protein DUNSADRAFT_15430 [Dunaliella salina]|eukprot:KAF5829845.1 hypothetical protein DUNSADRAFT_15430 [Dunaliella salina]